MKGSFVSLIIGIIIKGFNNNEVYWKFCLMLIDLCRCLIVFVY